MITCNEIMTEPVVTCELQDSIIDIATNMDVANVGSIPIVRDRLSQELVGIITDRDIVKRVVVRNLPVDTTHANEVMTSTVFTCQPQDTISTAVAIMSEYQVRRIPIVDDDKRIVGIIAQADIARYIDRQTTGAVVGEISEEAPERKLTR